MTVFEIANQGINRKRIGPDGRGAIKGGMVTGAVRAGG